MIFSLKRIKHMTFDGLSLSHAAGPGIRTAGAGVVRDIDDDLIQVEDWCNDITIQNCFIRETRTGVILSQGSRYILQDCVILDTQNGGIGLMGSNGNWPNSNYSYPISNTLVQNNIVGRTRNNDGIFYHANSEYVDDVFNDGLGRTDDIGDNHRALNNICFSCAENGFDITSGTSISLEGNITHDNNQVGISVGHYARDVTIRNHQSINDDASQNYGGAFGINDSRNVLIEGAVVTNPGRMCISIRNDAQNIEIKNSTFTSGTDTSRLELIGIFTDESKEYNVSPRGGFQHGLATVPQRPKNITIKDNTFNIAFGGINQNASRNNYFPVFVTLNTLPIRGYNFQITGNTFNTSSNNIAFQPGSTGLNDFGPYKAVNTLPDRDIGGQPTVHVQSANQEFFAAGNFGEGELADIWNFWPTDVTPVGRDGNTSKGLILSGNVKGNLTLYSSAHQLSSHWDAITVEGVNGDPDASYRERTNWTIPTPSQIGTSRAVAYKDTLNANLSAQAEWSGDHRNSAGPIVCVNVNTTAFGLSFVWYSGASGTDSFLALFEVGQQSEDLNLVGISAAYPHVDGTSLRLRMDLDQGVLKCYAGIRPVGGSSLVSSTNQSALTLIPLTDAEGGTSFSDTYNVETNSPDLFLATYHGVYLINNQEGGDRDTSIDYVHYPNYLRDLPSPIPAGRYFRTEFTDPDTSRATLDGTPNTLWRLTKDKSIRDYINYHNTQCWSPDGRYICIERWTTGPGSDNYSAAGGKASIEIWIIDLELDKEFRIDSGMAPRWANLSNTLFFVHRTGNGEDVYKTTAPSGLEVKRFVVETGELTTISYGVEELGETNSDDTYLYGVQRYRSSEQQSSGDYLSIPGQERVSVLMEILPDSTSQPVRFGDGTGSRPLPSRNHPVVIMRNKLRGVDQGKPFTPSRTHSDLDGTNMRTGTIFIQAGHQSWNGDGSYHVVGNSQAQGRKWNESYPSDMNKLANARTSDPGPCGHSGRWIVSRGTILDLRTGGHWEMSHGYSKIVYPSGTGDVSEPYDQDAKGSPDGTKVCLVSNFDLESKAVTRPTIPTGRSDDDITVLSTANFPESGDLVFESEVIGYSSKTPTSFKGIERGKYTTKVYGVEAGKPLTLLDSRILAEQDRDASNRPNYMDDTKFNPSSGDLRHQNLTDAYVVVVRKPDAPHLREHPTIIGQIQLIPGENHWETAGYRIFKDGQPLVSGSATIDPGATISLPAGVYTATSVEYNGLEGKISNEITTTTTKTLDILEEIPGDFSWIIELWVVVTDGTPAYTTEALGLAAPEATMIEFHYSEGVISSSLYLNGKRSTRNYTDYFGVQTKKEYYDVVNAESVLRLREFYIDPTTVVAKDGSAITDDEKLGIYSEEVFNTETGMMISDKHWRYDNDGFGGENVKRAKLAQEWTYSNGVPTSNIVGGSAKYIKEGDLWVRYKWSGGTGYDHYNPVDDWVVY